MRSRVFPQPARAPARASAADVRKKRYDLRRRVRPLSGDPAHDGADRGRRGTRRRRPSGDPAPRSARRGGCLRRPRPGGDTPPRPGDESLRRRPVSAIALLEDLHRYWLAMDEGDIPPAGDHYAGIGGAGGIPRTHKPSPKARHVARCISPQNAAVAPLVTPVPIGTSGLVEDCQGAGSGGSSETRYERRVYPAALSLPAP